MAGQLSWTQTAPTASSCFPLCLSRTEVCHWEYVPRFMCRVIHSSSWPDSGLSSYPWIPVSPLDGNLPYNFPRHQALASAGCLTLTPLLSSSQNSSSPLPRPSMLSLWEVHRSSLCQSWVLEIYTPSHSQVFLPTILVWFPSSSDHRLIHRPEFIPLADSIDPSMYTRTQRVQISLPENSQGGV